MCEQLRASSAGRDMRRTLIAAGVKLHAARNRTEAESYKPKAKSKYSCMRRFAFCIRRSAFLVRRSAFRVQCSAFSIQRSAFGIFYRRTILLMTTQSF
jgi:hypothetical protein